MGLMKYREDLLRCYTGIALAASTFAGACTTINQIPEVLNPSYTPSEHFVAYLVIGASFVAATVTGTSICSAGSHKSDREIRRMSLMPEIPLEERFDNLSQ